MGGVLNMQSLSSCIIWLMDKWQSKQNPKLRLQFITIPSISPESTNIGRYMILTLCPECQQIQLVANHQGKVIMSQSPFSKWTLPLTYSTIKIASYHSPIPIYQFSYDSELTLTYPWLKPQRTMQINRSTLNCCLQQHVYLSGWHYSLFTLLSKLSTISNTNHSLFYKK